MLTRDACCDHLIATYTYMRIHTFSFSLSLSLSLSASLSLPHSLSLSLIYLLTWSYYYSYLNYYLLFIIIHFHFWIIIIFFYCTVFFCFFYERGENASYAYSRTGPMCYVGLGYQVELPTRYSLLTKDPSFSRILSNTVYLTSRNLFSYSTKE